MATESNQPHEVIAYASVYKRLQALYSFRGTKITLNSSLVNALTRTFCPPWIYAPMKVWRWDKIDKAILNMAFQVGPSKADAGTIVSPDTSVILANAKPSETVGNGHGLEIPASEITFPDKKMFGELDVRLGVLISDNLFGKRIGCIPWGGNLALELYKLTVYGEGEHYDWRVDSPHADDHHATALLFLGSEAEGGDLKLRHGGFEFSREESIQAEHQEYAKPNEVDPDDGKVHLVAFYTDVEQKIDPVQKGNQIVLHFNVRTSESHTQVNPDEKKDSTSEYDTDEGDAYVDEDRCVEWGAVGNAMDDSPSVAVHSNPKALNDAARIIESRFSKSENVKRVAFPLRHSYRMASIRPEDLKGIDAALYERLTTSQDVKDKFKVDLHPVILLEETDDEGNWSGERETYVFVFESDIVKKNLKRKRGEEKTENERSWEDRDDQAKFTEFHLVKGCSLEMIDSQDYTALDTGKVDLGNNRYFGGAMFVSLKEGKA
ncbi:hypothetical protein VKT23_002895 [Stygiomarasmius scandens]|uniref:Uncharacterized protein n=1 Tax=Marasmiellus scandens TaxID=2682957 RepID=A0ABR1K198_9AGAR